MIELKTVRKLIINDNIIRIGYERVCGRRLIFFEVGTNRFYLQDFPDTTSQEIERECQRLVSSILKLTTE